MERSVASLLSLYRPENPLEKASTIPSPWYFDPWVVRVEVTDEFGDPAGRDFLEVAGADNDRVSAR